MSFTSWFDIGPIDFGPDDILTMGGTTMFDLAGAEMSMQDLPYVGGLFGKTDEEEAVLAAMQAAAQEYRDRRQPMAEARMQALEQTANLFQPTNTALTQMYGPGAAIPIDQLSNNPLQSQFPQETFSPTDFAQSTVSNVTPLNPNAGAAARVHPLVQMEEAGDQQPGRGYDRLNWRPQ